MVNIAPTQASSVDWTARLMALAAIALIVWQNWIGHNVPPVTPPVTPPIVVNPPVTPPTTDPVSMGRSYAVQGIAETWGDEMIAAGNAIKSGTDPATAQTNLKVAWNKDRLEKFDAMITPYLSSLSSTGTNLDAATRAKIGQAFIDMGNGAKQVK